MEECLCHRPGRPTQKEPLQPCEAPAARHGLGIVDTDDPVEAQILRERRLNARTEAGDQPTPRLASKEHTAHGIDSGETGGEAVLGAVARATADGPGGARSHEELVDVPVQRVGDLRHRPLAVGTGIRGILVLVEVHGAGDLREDLGHPAAPRGQEIAKIGIGLPDDLNLRAIGLHRCHSGSVRPRVHDAQEAYSFEAARTGECDAQVARTRFHDQGSLAHTAGGHRVSEQGASRTVLGAASGVEELELAVYLKVITGPEVPQPEQRGGPDEVRHVLNRRGDQPWVLGGHCSLLSGEGRAIRGFHPWIRSFLPRAVRRASGAHG